MHEARFTTPTQRMNDLSTIDYLAAHGIKPSVQRIAVMDYLLRHHTHPQAEDIYCALLPSMPTLSRTTVYNTLRLLTEQGAVCQLPLDDRRVCYDAHVEAHAHFLCTRCGALHDVPLRSPTPEEQAVLPQGYKAERASLCIKGCCPDCAAHEQQQHAAH